MKFATLKATSLLASSMLLLAGCSMMPQRHAAEAVQPQAQYVQPQGVAPQAVAPMHEKGEAAEMKEMHAKHEVEMSMSDLPEAVHAKVAVATKGAKNIEIEKEMVKGASTYEVNYTKGTHRMMAKYSASGRTISAPAIKHVKSAAAAKTMKATKKSATSQKSSKSMKSAKKTTAASSATSKPAKKKATVAKKTAKKTTPASKSTKKAPVKKTTRKTRKAASQPTSKPAM